MISSVIPARLEFSCGHVALVSLPRLKGEGATRRTERVSQEKTAARFRPCDFCGPSETLSLDARPPQELALSGASNGHHVADMKEHAMHSTEIPEPTPLRPDGPPNVTHLGAAETKRTFPPRRRLGDEQEREVTRLYVETTMPVAQIGQQFGIGESSVYRIAQRNGASLRGRTPASPAPVAALVEAIAAPVEAIAALMEAVAAPVDAVAAPVDAVSATVALVVPDAAPVPAVPVAKATRPRVKRAPRVPRVVPTPTPSPAAFEAPAAVPTPAPVPAAAPRTIMRRTRRPAAVTPVAASAAAPVVSAPAPSAATLRFRINFSAETVVEAADIRAALRHAASLGATEVTAIIRED